MKKWFIGLIMVGIILGTFLPLYAQQPTLSLWSLDKRVEALKANITTQEAMFVKKDANLPVSVAPYLSNSLMYDTIENMIKLKGDVANPGPNMVYGTDALGNKGWVPMGSSVISVANPVFNPAEGTYSSAQSVTLSSSTSGAIIRYTLDGSTPTSTVGTIYSGAITISSTTTVKAIAYKSGMSDSSVITSVYTISANPAVANPVFSPVEGVYASAQSVTITTSTSGASIRYTVDGTNPSSTTGTVYSGAISVSTSTTIKAIAYKSGMSDSMIVTSLYTIGSSPDVTYIAPTTPGTIAVSGSSGSTVTLPSAATNNTYKAFATLNANSGGSVGDLYSGNKTTSNFKVYCTGSNTTATFDWAIVETSTALQGTGTFNSTTGTTITLPSTAPSANYRVMLMPSASTSGSVGDIYITNKTTTNFKVYCTGSNTTTTFDWAIVLDTDSNLYTGSNTFNSTAGRSVAIGTTMLNTNYKVIVLPSAATSGSVGDYYVTNKSTTGFTVYCTGSNTTATFDWVVIP